MRVCTEQKDVKNERHDGWRDEKLCNVIILPKSPMVSLVSLIVVLL